MAQKRYTAGPSPDRNGTERRCSKQGEERAVDLQNRSESTVDSRGQMFI